MVECTAEVEAVVFVKDGEPQKAHGHICEDEIVVQHRGLLAGAQCTIPAAIAIVLVAPARIEEVDAALGYTCFGAQYQIVGFLAIATHFLGIRGRQFSCEGLEFCFTGLVSPKGATYAEVIITPHGDALVVRNGIGVISIRLEHAGPLIAIIGNQSVITIHHPRHGWIEVQRGEIELREMDILRENTRSTYRQEERQYKESKTFHINCFDNNRSFSRELVIKKGIQRTIIVIVRESCELFCVKNNSLPFFPFSY